MEEWKEYKLGEIAKVTMGQSPESSSYNNCGVGIPFMQGNRTFGMKYPSFDTYTTSITKMAEANDVIISVRAPVGDVNITPVRMCLGRGLCGIRANNGNHEFLYYLLRYYSKELVNKESGTVFGSVNRNDISNLSVRIPRNETQNVIANVLSSLDNKIEINRRINDNFTLSFLLLTCFVLWLLKLRNDNLEQQAKTIFKSWLSNCQAEVTIGDLSLNITDYSKCNSPKVVLVNSSDVTNGFFDHHILSDNMNLKGHFKKRFKKGDILYSQVRPRNRHWAYCTFEADHYLASTQLMVIRNKKEILPSVLLYQYLIEDDVWNEFTLKTETRSGTFPQGNYEDLASIQVPFGAEMNNIIPELESLYSLKYSIEKESRLLSSLRDTLLPKLMSGKLKMNKLTV